MQQNCLQKKLLMNSSPINMGSDSKGVYHREELN